MRKRKQEANWIDERSEKSQKKRKHIQKELLQLHREYDVLSRTKCSHCQGTMRIGSNSNYKAHIASTKHQKATKLLFPSVQHGLHCYSMVLAHTAPTVVCLPKDIVNIILDYVDTNVILDNVVQLQVTLSLFDTVLNHKPHLISWALENVAIPTSWFFSHIDKISKMSLVPSNYALRHHRFLFEMFPNVITYEMLQVGYWYEDRHLPNLRQLWEFYWNPCRVTLDQKQKLVQLQQKIRSLGDKDTYREISFGVIHPDKKQISYRWTNEYYFNLKNDTVMDTVKEVLSGFSPRSDFFSRLHSLFSNDTIHFDFLEIVFDFIEWSTLLLNRMVPISFLKKYQDVILEKALDNDCIAKSLLQCTVWVNMEVKKAVRTYLEQMFQKKS